MSGPAPLPSGRDVFAAYVAGLPPEPRRRGWDSLLPAEREAWDGVPAALVRDFPSLPAEAASSQAAERERLWAEDFRALLESFLDVLEGLPLGAALPHLRGGRGRGRLDVDVVRRRGIVSNPRFAELLVRIRKAVSSGEVVLPPRPEGAPAPAVPDGGGQDGGITREEG